MLFDICCWDLIGLLNSGAWEEAFYNSKNVIFTVVISIVFIILFQIRLW